MHKDEIIDVDAIEESPRLCRESPPVIDISSDDEIVELAQASRIKSSIRTKAIKARTETPRPLRKRPRSSHNLNDLPGPSKRRATDNVILIDADPSQNSDDEYETIHAGYDVRYEKNWRPCPVPLFVKNEKREANIDVDFAHLRLADERNTNIHMKAGRRQVKSEFSNIPLVPEIKDKRRIWDHLTTIRNSVALKPKKCQGSHTHGSTLVNSLGLNHLKLRTQTRGTSGCPTKIAQTRDIIAVSCATIGGGPEPFALNNRNPEDADPYNREGNLLVWAGSRQYSPAAHSKEISARRNAIIASRKFYSVNDVAFDPLRPHIMVSSGMDCAVQIWILSVSDEDGYACEEIRQIFYQDVPNDLSFRPNSSVLAISNYDGFIYVATPENHGKQAKPTRLRVSRDGFRGQKTGAFLWGANNTMFASSESSENADCRHVAFDVEEQAVLYEFHTTDSGDDMALNANKTQLALVTNGAEEGHFLRLYDVARGAGENSIASVRMTATSRKEELEINKTAFSPDGILLAVARNDNFAYVYDTRYMDQELYKLEHMGDPVSVEREREYGTTAAVWHEGIGGRGLGLVTSSIDGCVRFWDTSVAPDNRKNGVVIAQTDYDIACISMGDPQKGEHRLVVGDFGGGIYVFD